MSTSLFLLAAEYRETTLTLEDLDLPEEVVRDTLESISGDFEQKAENIAKFIRNMETSAEQIKEQAKKMIDRAKAIENRAASVKQYLFDGMKLANVPKIDTAYFKLAIRDNPPSVIVDDAAVVPSAYMTEPVAPAPAPDKALIKKAITDGFEVPGCRLVRGQRLDIR